MKSVTIREYRSTDKEALTEAIRQLHEYVVSHDPIKRLRNMPGYGNHEVEQTLKTIREQQGKIFIAEDNNKFVGFVAGFLTQQTEENLLSVIPTTLGVISDVYIAEQYRGEGIGEKLMHTMEKYLKDSGCDTIWITIVAFNTNAHKFYQRMGYADREIGLMKEI